LISLCGVLHLLDGTGFLHKLRLSVNAPSAGGWLGKTSYEYGFCMLGSVGASIVYATLYLISVLFLTNFQLGPWMRSLWGSVTSAPPVSPEEKALERKAQDLQKQAKKLQEEVERSGL